VWKATPASSSTSRRSPALRALPSAPICRRCSATTDALADGIVGAGRRVGDPVWRMPLHQPYRRMLDSKVADIANSSSSPYAGAITAALFLEGFVTAGTPWAHFDLMAWNLSTSAGRPEGGEAMALRAVYAHLADRFGR
jgi:leucyl aminopeptidase